MKTEDPVQIYLSTLSPGASRSTMEGVLGQAARWIWGEEADAHSAPWSEIDYARLAAYRQHLVSTRSPSTARKVLAALRGVLKACWATGAMSTDAYHRAIAVPPVKGRRLPAGHVVTLEEVKATLKACARDTRDVGRRDAALIALAYTSGLRRFELAGLDVGDLDLQSRSMTVHGKGDQQRLVPIPRAAIPHLEAWLEARGPDRGPLFRGCDRRGNLQSAGGLSDAAVWAAIDRRSRQAGVRRFAPHDCRRSTATMLLEQGEDLGTVKRILGHRDVSTTLLYDRRGDRVARAALDRIDLGTDDD